MTSMFFCILPMDIGQHLRNRLIGFGIYEPVMLLPMRLPFVPFPIVTASINQDSLQAALSGLACQKRMRNERIYLAERDTNFTDYQNWHDRATHALRNLKEEALPPMID